MPDPQFIRNFSIVAHIDHGKTTLSDRILERCGAVTEREMHEQMLDDMELEQERGITIKARAVTLRYAARDGEEYVLNLIDTPGHVDFSYEVSRSLSACEGAVLVIDATQGVEAQTLANAYLAVDHQLELLPVINKIDLPSANPERVRQEIEELIGLDGSVALLVSAKEGWWILVVLEGIIHAIPPPRGDPQAPLKALLFDSWFDPYQGAVIVVRVVDGVLRQGMPVRLMSSGKVYEVARVGVFAPRPLTVTALGPGEVGFLMAGIKEVTEARIGDTLTDPERPTAEALPGFKAVKPMVFSGLYPVEPNQYEALRDAVEKLRLNDASFTYEKESSLALGFGFRCGFLGLLHMEIVKERLEREFGLDLISTAPSVEYHVHTTAGDTLSVHSPAEMPPVQEIESVEEPMFSVTLLTPTEFTGTLMELCQQRRGDMKKLEYLSPERVELVYRVPLAEVVIDFFDQLKSRTQGYASLDYEPDGYERESHVKVDILLNGVAADAFSTIVHRDKATDYGRRMCEKLRELIPRQLFDVPIQAAIGGRIIARETVKARRKDVIAKCYGGDVTRKRKLLEQQKVGKRRMKQIGRVEVPQEAFVAALRLGD